MEKELTPVEVEWIDAQSSLDIYSFEELRSLGEEDLHITKSCGYLLHEDKDKVVLSFMNFGNGMCKHSQIIPKGMIRKITKLQEDKHGRKKDFRKSVRRNRVSKKTKRK